jgi:hypothetical protein
MKIKLHSTSEGNQDIHQFLKKEVINRRTDRNNLAFNENDMKRRRNEKKQS